jgi:phenylalanyl-tRNA synthetase alpha chain
MENIEKTLENIKSDLAKEIEKANSSLELDDIKRKYLGKKGAITSLLKELGKLPPSERPLFGNLVNAEKKAAEALIDEKIESIKELELITLLEKDAIDITLPGAEFRIGKLHPITKIMNEICDIFIQMGFSIAEGPEIELDYYNFEALNIHKDHPVRDTQDTFYITEEYLLRSQTSPVQIRVIEKEKPPIQIIAPGRCYRRDSEDMTHLPMFYQVEGLMVDTDISFRNLKGVLNEFSKQMFGASRKTRFRPSYFPFTEPSAEMDIQCGICQGKGCKSCKFTGWLEILGCGMMHPALFERAGYEKGKYTGFAFGMGPERIAMLKYNIADIRLFIQNDMRFLQQF